MSYKSWKRRDQRKRSFVRKTFWEEVRRDNATRAFSSWKEQYLPSLLRTFMIEGIR